jgi:hypothetical protein
MNWMQVRGSVFCAWDLSEIQMTGVCDGMTYEVGAILSAGTKMNYF